MVLNYFLIAKYRVIGGGDPYCYFSDSCFLYLFVPKTRIVFMQQTKALLPINLLIHLISKKQLIIIKNN